MYHRSMKCTAQCWKDVLAPSQYCSFYSYLFCFGVGAERVSNFYFDGFISNSNCCTANFMNWNIQILSQRQLRKCNPYSICLVLRCKRPLFSNPCSSCTILWTFGWVNWVALPNQYIPVPRACSSIAVCVTRRAHLKSHNHWYILVGTAELGLGRALGLGRYMKRRFKFYLD